MPFEEKTTMDFREEIALMALRLTIFSLSDETETSERSSNDGSRIGPYLIVCTLGAGGMGVVYRARDERLGRDVAIKVIRAGLLSHEGARKRFRKEALALARLNHPNIAAVYDVGVHDDGSDYLVMEFVPGITLRERLGSGPIAPAEILSLAAEIAQALDEAHEQGVVHRDLKPSNVIVTRKGHAKILDFGLAKLLTSGIEDVTHPQWETAGIVGTPLYMSPEQADGKDIDARADLWSLGVILYESMAGRPPFRGDSALAILRSVSRDTPEPLRNVPPDASRIVARALEKDVARRYSSASEMARDLSAAVQSLSAPAIAAPRSTPWQPYLVVSALLLVIASAIAGWLYHRSERRRWAREEAIPGAVKLLNDDRKIAAFRLLGAAEQWLPGDAGLAKIKADNSAMVAVDSLPPGATVEIQDYLAPRSDWLRIGVAPLKNVRVPKGYFRWRVSKLNLSLTSAPDLRRNMHFDLSAPAGMVRVPDGKFSDMIAFIGWVGPYKLPAYDIDRFEVTNREYQKFVDSGGYTRPGYWVQKFTRNGRDLTFAEAMTLLRDRTGRAGPSTWQAGHYPEGHGDDPVSGVSWYEASAYAAFANKSLPALGQWFRASPEVDSPFIVHQSNISSTRGVLPVGASNGVGPFGTVDMIGNVREWVSNRADEDQYFILGGAWNSQTYLSVDPEALPAFDRSPTNGFRCVRNLTALKNDVTAPIKIQNRDFAHFKPASDDVFRVYRSMYSYDKLPLNAKVDGVVQDTADWRVEKVSFDAAYGGERMTAYLFVPRRVQPPFQTVVFFPSARVLYLNDSSALGDVDFFDYVALSGRAVLYPVYKGTYERRETFVLPGMRRAADLMIQHFKDVSRAVEYLKTRRDIDQQRIAYMGVSMGAAEGVIYTTLLQDAFKTVILLDGGYFLYNPPAGADQADFAPRLKRPVLMVNGRYDFTFSLQRSQEPLFRMLGASAADKRHVVLETPHDVTARRAELGDAVLGWLDKYFGRVQ